MVISAIDDGRYQHNPKFCFPALFNYFFADFKEWIRLLGDAVKMKIEGAYPCIFQFYCKLRVLCYLNAVCRNLYLAESHIFCFFNNSTEIVSHGGLTP